MMLAVACSVASIPVVYSPAAAAAAAGGEAVAAAHVPSVREGMEPSWPEEAAVVLLQVRVLLGWRRNAGAALCCCAQLSHGMQEWRLGVQIWKLQKAELWESCEVSAWCFLGWGAEGFSHLFHVQGKPRRRSRLS
eukprot:1158820-Pelagomonas_calceolata.AAC.3